VEEVPIVVSRICGICPVVHILNACEALEKALEIKVSASTVLLRKLFLASQIIHSHALHLFFLSLPDFLNIDNDLELIKKFKKETKATLKIRDFALEITEIIGGRKVHPVTPTIGGFRKAPDISEFKKSLKELPGVIESALILAKTLEKLSYPELKRETDFLSVFSKKEYAFYKEDFVKIEKEKFSIGDFYSNKIEEDLRIPPVKKTKYKGKSYMVGAVARIKNNANFLNPQARNCFEDFLKKNNLSKEDFFKNRFYNLFSQAVEILHFLEVSQLLIKDILEINLEETKKDFKISKGSGLSAMEAPRGTLFTYFEIDKKGRILNCNIITPTAQFLANLEEDLKVFLPQILKFPQNERIRKIRSLIRVYDPCISCATH
jgi:coenzyme F420-reducing hydrogenase alpha subunit